MMARRLFSHQDDAGRVSRPAISISTLGVAIGVAVMLISVSVALGFQREVQAKLLGFGAHIQVFSYESLGSEELKPIVVDEAVMQRLAHVPGVKHVQRFSVKPGMLKTDADFRGVVFRGVGQEYDTQFLRDHLVAGEMPVWSDSVSSGSLLVSQHLAHQLKLEVGSTVYAYFFENAVKARRFRVSGIYCTHLTDFDSRIVFADLHTVHGLLGWDSDQQSGAELLTEDFSQLDQVMGRVVKAINKQQDAYGAQYTSMTIRELYPQVFAWLHLLDLDVWVILILMTCVAGFTMISGLLIIILHWRDEGDGSHQQRDASPLSALCGLHRIAWYALWQPPGSGSVGHPALHRHSASRSRGILCGFCASTLLLALLPAGQPLHPHLLPPGTPPPQLHHLLHPSRPQHTV